jgi:hypothetical protein
MATKSTTYLDCFHKVEFYIGPTPGEEIWCVRCRGYSRVILPDNVKFIKCRNCKFSRTFVNSPIRADRSATDHRQKYHSHTVEVWGNDSIMHVYGGDLQETLELDVIDLEPVRIDNPPNL